MSILNRYLLRQNLYYTAILLFSGMMVYLIVDFVGRMNAMVDAGIGPGLVLKYFIYKVPLIVAQIMPAIFMLGVLIQIALMSRSNELVALESSAVSFKRPAGFFILYALVFFLVLLVFSETLGTRGEQVTREIWNEDVRQRQADTQALKDIWFKERDYLVHVKQAQPEEGTGDAVTVYKKDSPGSIQEIIQAPEFEIQPDRWILNDAKVFQTVTLERQVLDRLELDIRTDLSSFSFVASDLPYRAWAFFTLSALISQLKESGSNVEKLSTALHSKIAYPFALVVMTLLALAIFTRIRNIYSLVTLALVIVFFYYTVYVFGVSYAEEGLVAPFAGAWAANMLFGSLSIIQIFFMDRR